MKLEQVRCFFQMLTQLEDVQPYEALISTAVTTVTDALKPNVDPTLQPLQLLAAAIANESYQILLATKEQTACTYAGTTPRQADRSHQVTAARKLREQYQQMCSPMLLDRQFYFQRTHLNREEQSEEDAANSKPSTEPATGTADAGYLAYDHMPTAQKATPFVVLNLQACQTEAPVFRSEQETVPFSATVTVTLLMPIETHAAELSGTFTAEILPVLMQQQNLQTVQLSAPKPDRLLNRQTITATCQLFGFFQSEIEQAAAKEDV